MSWAPWRLRTSLALASRSASGARTQSSSAPASSARAKLSVCGVARIVSRSSASAAPVSPAATAAEIAAPTGPVAIPISPAAVIGPTYLISPTKPAKAVCQASPEDPAAPSASWVSRTERSLGAKPA